MKVFDGYAKFYDLFYQEKDYELETKFICSMKDRYAERDGKSILDLGCGTGGHALFLARQGYQITGVDLSENMIEQAKRKAEEMHLHADFFLGDIRLIDLGKTFDHVISMFAVMGYQSSNDDFFSALKVARRHLNSGGLFMFDAWFGPAVLKDKPETRIKEFSLGEKRVVRMAVPELHALENTVTVHYTVLQFAGDRIVSETRESHTMRFFFAPEVAFFAQQAGFKVEKICPFLSVDRIPSDRDWNVTWVLRAV